VVRPSHSSECYSKRPIKRIASRHRIYDYDEKCWHMHHLIK